MSTLLKPQGRIPIGFAMVNGQRVPVTIDIEWDRFLDVLTERAGGVVGPNNIVNFIQSTVAPSVVLDNGSDTGDDFVMPGPKGDKGDKGEPGPAIFLLEDPIENDIFWRV